MLRTGSLALLSFFVLVLAAQAHDREPSWMDASALDGGIYVGVSHPRVLRTLHPFELSVLVSNVRGDSEAVVTALRYTGPAAREPLARRFEHRLRSHRDRFVEYHAVRERTERLTAESPESDREALLQQRAQILGAIASDFFVDRYAVRSRQLRESSGALRISVEVDLLENGSTRTIRRDVTIPIESALPDGTGLGRIIVIDAKTGTVRNDSLRSDPASRTGGLWFAGDQHLHTAFSIDAFFANGTRDTVTGYATAARATGLDWIIVTEHSNVDFELFGVKWYTSEQFAAGAAEAEAIRNASGFLVLNGQEMGVGALGPFGESAHLLAYPRAVDSTGFLANPCSGIVFNHVNCEPEQIVIDRVNDAGGIGFIAHPFDEALLAFAPWDFDSGVVGWAGLEVFNSSSGTFGTDDVQALVKWFDLLRAIPAPAGGQLPVRMDYPTRFPVALGNSDAHEPGLIGGTFTYCRLPDVTRENVMDAFVHGRCVASNGPLVYGAINGAGTGDVALVDPSGNTLEITLQTTPEFGPVGDYAVFLFANGVLGGILPPSGSTDFSTTLVFQNLAIGRAARFINVVAASVDGSRISIANPIWLEFP